MGHGKGALEVMVPKEFDSCLSTGGVLLEWRQGAEWAGSDRALHLGPRAHGGLVHAHSALL